MKVAEFAGITHRYNDQVAIKNLSIGFEANKITAIIGMSGSGKSTALQLINGLVRPTLGDVRVFNQALNYNELTSMRLKIGYMVQNTGLFPHLTVAQNISIASKLTSEQTNPLNRTEELMELVNIPVTFKKKYPYQLSGGEQQRVGICRALFLNPPLLLMDEPLGALDPLTRQEIQNEIHKLQEIEPRSILLVTHDLREAKKLADFIVVMDSGRLLQFDTTENVLQKPSNEKVKKLIDASLS
jgi:osmoprotectant transport system ATP-binding protein